MYGILEKHVLKGIQNPKSFFNSVGIDVDDNLVVGASGAGAQ